MGIIAVDPGTSNTGLVYMDERRVIDVRTLHYPKLGFDQAALLERALTIWRQLEFWSFDKPHEIVVMEGFIGYPGMQGGYTYQTPYLCGYLQRALQESGEPFAVQTSRQVLNRKTEGNVRHVLNAMLAGEEVWGDCSKCTNEHLRSALMHGIYYYEQEDKRNGKEV